MIVTFARAFEILCRPGVVKCYPAGFHGRVPRVHAAKARAAGALKEEPDDERSEPRPAEGRRSGAEG